MKDQIVEKLRPILSDHIDSECKVVYVLAECRKLLEKYPPDPIPFALKMYCHWALHVDLTNPGTTFPFLQRVDEFVASVLFDRTDFVLENRMFREFVFLETFRQQLRHFLTFYDLPTAVCDDDLRWHEFLEHYGGVVEDGSLRCQAKSQRLRFVDEVIISERKGPRPSDTYAPFDLSWEIILLDGRSLTVEVYAAAFPDGTPMIVHGIKLNSPALNRG